MSRDTTVIPFRQPEAIDDPLSELAREGARRMLAQVLIAEADSFVAAMGPMSATNTQPTAMLLKNVAVNLRRSFSTVFVDMTTVLSPAPSYNEGTRRLSSDAA